MTSSRTINSIRNILTGFAGQFISMIISFVNRLVFVHVLSEAYLGINGLFSNVLSVLSLAELGISSAITFALYKPLATNDKTKLSSLMHFYAKAYKIIGVIVGLVGLCLMPFLKYIIADPGNIHENIYLIYALFLFNTTITYFYSYKSSLITADQKNYIISFISYSVLIIQTVFQILILLFIGNYIFYLICQSIGNLFTNILISYWADKKYPFLKDKKSKELTNNEKRSLFINIKALMIIKVSGILVNSTDNIIITATKGLGLVSTGIASNYTLLISTLNSILAQIFSGITASVGNLNAIESKKKQLRFFNVINLLNFWLFGWCAISFIILGSDIVELLFGNKYVLSQNIVIIMALNFYTVGMQNAIWTYKSTMGLYDYGKYLTLITGIINIILSILFAKKMGLFGIYLATLVSRLLTNIWYDPYAVFKYGLHVQIFNYFIKYAIYLCILFFVTIVIELFCMIVRLSFLCKLITCIIIPNVIFFVCFYKTREFKYLMNKFKYIISR